MRIALFILYRLILRLIALAMALAGLGGLLLLLLEAFSGATHGLEQWAMGGVAALALAGFAGFAWPLWRYAGGFPPAGSAAFTPWLERPVLLLLVVAALIQAKGSYDFSMTYRPVLPALALLAETRQAMTRWYRDHGHWPRLAPDGDLKPGQREAVARLEAISGGPGATALRQELTATLAPTLPEPWGNRTVRMVTDDGGTHWQCLPGTLSPDRLPPGCQTPGVKE